MVFLGINVWLGVKVFAGQKSLWHVKEAYLFGRNWNKTNRIEQISSSTLNIGQVLVSSSLPLGNCLGMKGFFF